MRRVCLRTGIDSTCSSHKILFRRRSAAFRELILQLRRTILYLCVIVPSLSVGLNARTALKVQRDSLSSGEVIQRSCGRNASRNAIRSRYQVPLPSPFVLLATFLLNLFDLHELLIS